jgi:LmbE family N-acetylglucosaminyl deacetylase
MANGIRRALVVVAHPDDAEFGAGGTVARLVGEGAEVTYLVVTSGDMGSADRSMTRARLGRLREAEQREAARVLGVGHVEFLRHPDGEVENTRGLRRDVTRAIRRWRPDLIIAQNPLRTHDLHGSHRDHRVTAEAVFDCVYPLAGDPLAFPERVAQSEPHEVREVWIMRWHWETHELAMDITGTLDLKLRALGCHRSQLADPARMRAWVRDRCAAFGRPHGYPYAEPFDRILIPPPEAWLRVGDVERRPGRPSLGMNAVTEPTP